MKDLTIIVPVYNVSKYLNDCLNSLTYGITKEISEKVEIIIINDGSTDDSLKICQKYASKFSVIRLINKKNEGIATTRNKGIELAKGKYISFIDSDDIVTTDYLSTILKIINMIDFDLLTFEYKTFVNNESQKQVSYIKKQEYIKRVKKVEIIDSLTIDKVGSFAWNKIYKKKLFTKVRYPKDRYFEDVSTTYKLVDNATIFYELDKVLYYYRQRVGSILHQSRLDKKLNIWGDAILARYELFVFLEHNGSYSAQKNNNKYLFQDCISLIKAVYSSQGNKDYLSYLQFLNKFKFSVKRDGIKHTLFMKIYLRFPQCFKILYMVKNK